MNAAAPVRNEKPHILMVEDSSAQAAYLRSLLEAANYEVAHAANGAEALDLLGLRLPAIIISDVMMPVMDGYELCCRVKADAAFRQVPFMLLTSLANPQDIFKGLESGADYYSVKPYAGAVLMARLRTILDEQRVPSATHLPPPGLAVTYAGRKYSLNAGRSQILDLLLATFENIGHQNNALVETNHQLSEANHKLSEALEANKVLHGMLPICSYCKKIRDDHGYWEKVESFVAKHSEARFSHGICPQCLDKAMGDMGITPEMMNVKK